MHMPNSIFSRQTTLNKMKFLKFALKIPTCNPGLHSTTPSYVSAVRYTWPLPPTIGRSGEGTVRLAPQANLRCRTARRHCLNFNTLKSLTEFVQLAMLVWFKVIFLGFSTLSFLKSEEIQAVYWITSKFIFHECNYILSKLWFWCLLYFLLRIATSLTIVLRKQAQR